MCGPGKRHGCGRSRGREKLAKRKRPRRAGISARRAAIFATDCQKSNASRATRVGLLSPGDATVPPEKMPARNPAALSRLGEAQTAFPTQGKKVKEAADEISSIACFNSSGCRALDIHRIEPGFLRPRSSTKGQLRPG